MLAMSDNEQKVMTKARMTLQVRQRTQSDDKSSHDPSGKTTNTK